MTTKGGSADGVRRKITADAAALPLEHYVRLILYRKWLVLGVFVGVTLATIAVTLRMKDIYTSETVILVDPQQVPEAYVKATVTGDVRNRLGTLSQQILSATRLQKIIEGANLYPEERKTMAREDVILKMRSDISVHVVGDFGGSQDLQAFRIVYCGNEPRLVAQVTNQLASLFIEENLKAREQQATGTTEFLQNQLQETRKALEIQEGKLRDFKLRHIGEMPEQQTADLQILGQLQSQLQLEGDALSRAEQQKSYIQSMVAHSAPVVDLEDSETRNAANPERKTQSGAAPPQSAIAALRANLAAMQSRYTDSHPEVRRLKKQLEGEEAKLASAAPAPAAAVPAPAPAAPVPLPPAPARRVARTNTVNPVLQSQLLALDAEIAKHKQEQERLARQVNVYRSKLDAIPVREQEIAQLVRDYEISKGHYKQLLEKQLSAETATQLEIRQKGEKFAVLDAAQAAERPTRPNRMLIDAAGSLGGLVLGLLLAIGTELVGMSITAPQDVTAASGLPVLEVIPIIQTEGDRLQRKRRIMLAAGCFAVALLVCAALFLYHRHSQI